MFNSRLNLALAAALLLGAAASSPAQTAKDQEAKLIAVLKSDAAEKEKADACRELARIGTRDAVPALAALLVDERMNHMARYGLETIPDPSVDQALRDALGRVKGRPLVGVIGSIGVRHDTAAVGLLAGLLGDGDADVAQAAARALGKIGDAAAAKALQAALPNVADANRLAFCEGLLRCAEIRTTAGQADEARAIYDQLRALPGPHQVRTAALRGAILSRGPAGLALLQENLGNADYLLFAAAVRTSMELPGPEVTRALAESLGRLQADNQVVVIQALGKRADAEALPVLIASTKAGPKTVRIAAIRALPEIGRPSAAPVLIQLLEDPEREVAQAAQESLAALPGPEVDAAVMEMLKAAAPAQRLTAIDLMVRRRMTGALPALLAAANDTDGKVRATALRRAGELASLSDLPVLLDRLTQAKGAAEVEAAEQAINMVCSRGGSPEASAEKLVTLLPQAQPTQKAALVRVLGALGGPVALKTVRAAVDDSNRDVHTTAIRTLGDWKTADAAPDLLALAKSAADPTDKMLCLRSCLGLARNTDVPAAQRLSICKQAAELTQKPEEKRLLLAALGGIPTVESVGLITPHLDDPAIKEEAAAATVAVAEKLLKGKDAAQVAGRLVEPLQKAAQATANPDLAKRAQDALKQAQSKAGK
jgi:HEAT repeat protein